MFQAKSIAFIMCVYGGDSPSHFRDALASIHSLKTESNFHVRIFLHVDGTISSELETVILEFDLYKIVRSPKNVGLAVGLNLLIKLLTNEKYIFRMDADDLCRKDRLSEQISFLDLNDTIDFVGGGIAEFNGCPSNVVAYRNYPENAKEISANLSKSSPFAHVTVCFRGGFFERFGLYPIEYPLNEDVAFWLECLKQGAVGANLQSILVDVRMDNAYSRRTYKKAFVEFKVYLNAAKWLRSGYVYPFLRLVFRLLPSNIVRFIYNSSIRRFFLEKKL
ncbi:MULTISPECIES: glycosyltransferase [unclassified Agarivorans]|uniref:glycosyltransferase n=1 Tax=unclassified Agarivorans TaxID=2636026 RepID=UPI0026E1ED91|nr:MULTISPECIES: glycosyltransferase [unclassified Agarivorans]MDO6686276.1 glycosyltransferase [Agarivorans sp. 3_MG-2023]MDO6716275.1 glycosyltransferase [Agarivorans sp. 2_MG-2023]